MASRIPKFEGEEPVAARLKINAISTDTNVFKRNSTVYLCVEVHVDDIDHMPSPAGLIRLQKSKMQRVCQMDEFVAQDLLNASDEQRANEEARANGEQLIIE